MNGKSDAELGLEDALIDDDELLPDKILRNAHRSKDGHIASSRKHHIVDPRDNMLVLYVYTRDEEGCTMHRHYVYAPRFLAYNSWRDLAYGQSHGVSVSPGVIGVFGWNTTFVNFTPLRENDLLTKVTKEKFVYVRLTFSARKANSKTRAALKKKPRKRHHRFGNG